MVSTRPSGKLPPPDPILITLQVVQAFDSLGIPYLIGGSLATIIHGVVRTTADADLVADINPRQVHPLVRAQC